MIWPSLCRRRIGLPALAEHRLVVRGWRQLPCSGRRGTDLGVDMHVEQKWPVGLDRVLKSPLEVLRLRHRHRLDAACFGPSGEVRVVGLLVFALMEHGAMLATSEHAELNVADRDPAKVI